VRAAGGGRRPVVVLRPVTPRSHPCAGRWSRTCTTTIRSLASEVVLEPGDDPLPQRSAVNLDSVESVPVGALVQRIGRLADVRMRDICGALAIAVDCQD
jgi:mRNA interferase MazF